MNSFCVSEKCIGTTIKESCGTEPTKLTNITNSLAISVTNSSLDQVRFRNAVTGILLSEMANAAGKPLPGTPSAGTPSAGAPSVISYPTPPTSLYPQLQSQQPPIIVVQPPAQQIFFGKVPYADGLSRPVRSPG